MLQGVYTALITPFTKKGEVDYKALEALVEVQIEGGVAGLVPVGTTGESPTLSHKENLKVVEAVVKAAGGRVTVIAGTGSNNTQEALDMTLQAKELGADASLQVAPYYNKPNQEGFYRHFLTLADNVDMPLVIYNIPGRTGKNIETDTVMRLADHPQVTAVKEASGSIPQMMEVIDGRPEGFSVLSGDDNLTFPLCCLGGEGVISVASNLIPRRMVELVKLTREGRLEEARKAHFRLMPLFRGMFLDTNPLPVKAAMAMMRKDIEEVYRLPLVPLTRDQKSSLKKILKKCDVL